MKKLLFLLWLPSAVFSSIMYTSPGVTPGETVGIIYTAPDYAGESSWFSLWSDSLTATKTSSVAAAGQNTVTLPTATLTNAGSWSDLVNNGTLATYDSPAAVAASPEPGTWGLLAVSAIPGLFALYRRRTK